MQKVYTEKAVSMATALGGPLVGGYLMAQNASLLGLENQLPKIWTTAGTITAGLAALIISAPAWLEHVPNVVTSAKFNAVHFSV